MMLPHITTQRFLRRRPIAKGTDWHYAHRKINVPGNYYDENQSKEYPITPIRHAMQPLQGQARLGAIPLDEAVNGGRKFVARSRM
jgi:hypothetical protein